MTDYEKDCRALAEQFYDDVASAECMYAALYDMVMSAHEEGFALAFGILGMAEAIREQEGIHDYDACRDYTAAECDRAYDHVLDIVAKHVTPQQYNTIACEVYPDPWLDAPLTEEEKQIVESRKLEDAVRWEEIKEKLKPLLKSLTKDYERIVGYASDDNAVSCRPSEDAELDSPNFVPKELVEFAERGFERRSRFQQLAAEIDADGPLPTGVLAASSPTPLSVEEAEALLAQGRELQDKLLAMMKSGGRSIMVDGYAPNGQTPNNRAVELTRDQALAWAAEDECDESVLAWGELQSEAELDSPNFVPKELVEFAERGFERQTILCPCGAFAKRTFDNYCSSRCRADALVIDRELTREQVVKEAEDFARIQGYASFDALWEEIEAGGRRGTLLEMYAKGHKHLLGGGE